MIEVKVANEYACFRACELAPNFSCIFKSFKGNLQQLSLRWIHGNSFERRNAEESVIEASWVMLQEVAPPSIYTTRSLLFRMIESFPVEYVALKVSVPGLAMVEQLPKF